MKILALVENQSNCELKATHGLSLYIETPKHKILFDVGPDNTLFENSEKYGIDLKKVDTVILSHGHTDHGGVLEQFLKMNHTAKVYAQRKAFEKHYSKAFLLKINIGIDSLLQTHPQVVLLDGDTTIDDELTVFIVTNIEKNSSKMNKTFYTDAGQDDFSHEQNLIIFGDTTALIMGCGHAGIVNVLEKAKIYKPQICVGGYHLCNPLTKKTVPNELLDGIASEMAKHDIHYYTCHCTGQEAFHYFAKRLPKMSYLSCGEMVK